jgi:hypothetical protein
MKRTAVLGLVLFGAACNPSSEEDALKAEIDSIQRAYEEARQELRLKKDSAKLRDLSKDAAFLARLNAAEERTTQLKQARGQKKREFRTHKKEENPRTENPGTE